MRFKDGIDISILENYGFSYRPYRKAWISFFYRSLIIELILQVSEKTRTLEILVIVIENFSDSKPIPDVVFKMISDGILVPNES